LWTAPACAPRFDDRGGGPDHFVPGIVTRLPAQMRG
jgi:hypothetical protein